MRHQASETIGPWINEAIDKHWDGGRILWEAGLVPAQGSAVICCVFWIPGTTLGTVQQGSFLIHDPLSLTKADIDETVADFLGQMLAAQSQELEARTQHPASGAQQTIPQPPAPQQASGPAVRGQQRPSGLYVV